MNRQERADQIITRELSALAESNDGSLPRGYANRIVETLKNEGVGTRRTNALKSIREWAEYLQMPGVVTRTDPEQHVTQRAHYGKPIKQQAALSVVAIMRREKQSLTAAVDRHNRENPQNRISAKTVKSLVPNALEKRGRFWKATRYDRYARVTDVIATKGVLDLTIRDSRTSSLIARHHAAVRAYLSGEADEDILRRFHGKYFRVDKREYTLETDPAILVQLGLGGELDDLIIGSGQETSS
jgi:hypothetical protein